MASKVLFPVVAGSWHVFEDGQRRPYSLATNYDPLYDIPPLYTAQVTSQFETGAMVLWQSENAVSMIQCPTRCTAVSLWHRRFLSAASTFRSRRCLNRRSRTCSAWVRHLSHPADAAAAPRASPYTACVHRRADYAEHDASRAPSGWTALQRCSFGCDSALIIVAANSRSCNAAMKLVYEHNDVIEDVVQRGWGLDCLAVIETQSMVRWLPKRSTLF